MSPTGKVLGPGGETVFTSISEDDFPFLIEYIDEATGGVLGSELVTGPGSLLVPSWAPAPVTIRTSWPDGLIVISTSDGTTTTSMKKD